MHRMTFALSLAALVAVAAGSSAARPAKAPWRIALTSNREGDSEIYAMNADGTRRPAADAHARLRRLRTVVAGRPEMLFYSQRRERFWVMNADGTGQRNLTQNARLDGAGSWSPDGRRIVFTNNRDGNNEIYVMNADGSGQRNLSPSPSSPGVRSRGWSPDGRTIALRHRPRRQLGDLRHGRRRRQPAKPDEASAATTAGRAVSPGRRTDARSPSRARATRATRSTARSTS